MKWLPAAVFWLLVLLNSFITYHPDATVLQAWTWIMLVSAALIAAAVPFWNRTAT